MSKEEFNRFPIVDNSFTESAQEASKLFTRTFNVYGPRAVLHSALIRRARLLVYDQESLDRFIKEHELTFPRWKGYGFTANVEPLNHAGLFTIHPRKIVRFFDGDDKNVFIIQLEDRELTRKEYKKQTQMCEQPWTPEDFLDKEKLKEAAQYASDFYSHVIDAHRRSWEKITGLTPEVEETRSRIIDYFDSVIAAGNF